MPRRPQLPLRQRILLHLPVELVDLADSHPEIRAQWPHLHRGSLPRPLLHQAYRRMIGISASTASISSTSTSE